MKARFTCLASILVLMGISFAKYSGGTGEPNDPYLIATPNDLNAIGADPNDWDKHFKMIADINLAGFTGDQFNIIGATSPYFTGIFDGNGHSISNFTYNSMSAYCIGFFGYIDLESSEIKNLILIRPNIDVGDGEVCGSLAGYLYHGKIHSCRVIDCNVSGRNFIGGLVGANWHGEIHNSSTSGKVNGLYDSIGGLAGVNEGIIQNCSSSGSLIQAHGSWNKFVGGLVGHNTGEGQILSCFARNEISGHTSIGGLVGINAAIVENCYSSSNVDANENAGGLIGSLFDSSVSRSYSCGLVSVGKSTGIFVGFSMRSVFLDCFWDISIAPDINGIGNIDDSNVVGLPTAEMQRRSTFTDAGWDMVNIWDIGENQTYPFLRTHLPSDINKDDETNFLDLAIQASHWLDEK